MAEINATQLIGMLAFGAAAAAALLACRAGPGERRHWALIALANLAMAFECWLGLRHRLHDLAMAWLMAHGLYRERHTPQEVLIAVAAIVGLGIALAILIRARKRSLPCLVAWSTTISSIVLFAIETVSLHNVDMLLYGASGAIARIGWLWFGLGIATALCARTTVSLGRVQAKVPS